MMQVILKVLQCNCIFFKYIFLSKYVENEILIISIHKIIIIINFNIFSDLFIRYFNKFIRK